MIITIIKSLYHSYKSGVFSGPKSTEATIASRRLVCTFCKQRRKVLNMCKVCECFVETKIRFAKSECPLGKWKQQ